MHDSGRLLGNEYANYLHNGDGDDELHGLGGKDTPSATTIGYMMARATA